jgi:hypothetical protein
MPADLDSLLDGCLTARAAGQPLETCLNQLDEKNRADIEPIVLLADLLRETPRPALSAAANAAHLRRLLARAAVLRTGRSRVPGLTEPGRRTPLHFLSTWRLSFVPAAIVLLLAASLLLVGSAGSIVSYARPDDAFYNLKLSWEQTQVLLATNDAQRARALVDIAQHRLTELESLAEQGRIVPPELLLQVQTHVDQAILLCSSLRARQAIPILRDITELLSYQRMLLLRFAATLEVPERVTVERALQSIEASQQAASEALQERVEEQVSAPITPTTAASDSAALPDEPREYVPAISDLHPHTQAVISTAPLTTLSEPTGSEDSGSQSTSRAAVITEQQEVSQRGGKGLHAEREGGHYLNVQEGIQDPADPTGKETANEPGEGLHVRKNGYRPTGSDREAEPSAARQTPSPAPGAGLLLETPAEANQSDAGDRRSADNSQQERGGSARERGQPARGNGSDNAPTGRSQAQPSGGGSTVLPGEGQGVGNDARGGGGGGTPLQQPRHSVTKPRLR